LTGADGQEVEKMTLHWGGLVEVDVEIADLVRVLNKNGYPTRASCSGHGKRPGSIMLLDGREILIVPRRIGQRIHALFPPL
jgi:hypothetical protein